MNSSDSSPTLFDDLQNVVDQSKDEFSDLTQEGAALVESMAIALFAVRRTVAVDESSAKAAEAVVELVSNPAMSRALDHEMVYDAIYRLKRWQERLSMLSTATVRQLANAKVRSYAHEAANSFLYGFDAPAIAFCRATFEQVVKEMLVSDGRATWDHLRRKRRSLGRLLEEARKEPSLLPPGSEEPIDVILNTGNTVLHQHPYDDRIRRQTAADSITALAAALSAIYA